VGRGRAEPARRAPIRPDGRRFRTKAPLDLGARSRVYLLGMALTVSALADQVGLSADTVRYYERVGLLPEPARSASGYRLYDQTAVGRLRRLL
jgi:hypothetical protein